MSDKCPTCRKLADALAELLDAVYSEGVLADGTIEYVMLAAANANAISVLKAYTKETPHAHS